MLLCPTISQSPPVKVQLRLMIKPAHMAQTAKSNQQDPASSSSESSSAPKPAVRKKKWAAKTKTGCMTCRFV